GAHFAVAAPAREGAAAARQVGELTARELEQPDVVRARLGDAVVRQPALAVLDTEALGEGDPAMAIVIPAHGERHRVAPERDLTVLTIDPGPGDLDAPLVAAVLALDGDGVAPARERPALAVHRRIGVRRRPLGIVDHLPAA